MGPECAKFAKETASQSTSRSGSLKKRQKGQDTEHAAWEEETVEWSDEEEEQRGRKRRRPREEWWSSSTSYLSTNFKGSDLANSLRDTEREAV